MPEEFTISINHHNKQTDFEAEFEEMSRYTHRITVKIGEVIVYFEPDEERNYRAILADPRNHPDKALIQAIAEKLHSLFK